MRASACATCAIGILCLIFCTSCVRHSGRVHINDPSWTVLQDGIPIEGDATFSSALPTETQVDAWFRDSEGHIHRAHVHLNSPKPWWQRFPADILSDLLCPGQLQVTAKATLIMQEASSYSKASLDRLAEIYGYGSDHDTANKSSGVSARPAP